MKARKFSDAQKAFFLKQGKEGTPVGGCAAIGWSRSGRLQGVVDPSGGRHRSNCRTDASLDECRES